MTQYKETTDTGSMRAKRSRSLTRRETRQLRQALWNNLTRVVNEAVEPLSADRR